MEIGEISLLSIVTAVAPMALFVLLALFAPLVYRRIAGKLIEKFRPHQPQWISIILDSYLSPTTILLRCAAKGGTRGQPSMRPRQLGRLRLPA